MSGGVPTQISGQQAARLHHYVILSYHIVNYNISRLPPSTSASPLRSNLIPACPHQCRSAGNPGLQSSDTAMSKIIHVDMYWVTVFWIRVM